MSWQQVIAPKVPWPYVGGWCQGFVEGSFGQASAPQKDAQGNWYTVGPYPSAKAAWDANYGGGRHPNELPPKGVAVPVYFTLGSTPAGHVAISMPDGTVLSSTQGGWHSAGAVHPNLQHLIDVYAAYNNGCNYLGWQEYVGKVQVVKEEDMTTREDLEKLWAGFLDRPVMDAEYKEFVGRPLETILDTVWKSPEFKTRMDGLRKQWAEVQAGGSSDAAKKLQAIKDALGVK